MVRNFFKVCIVEDDISIIELLSIHLSDLSYDTSFFRSGEELFKRNNIFDYDLFILDLMLPGMDGFEICKKLRARKYNKGIIMLTAKTEEIDTILGLEIGADDYITKPFSVREFVARVKAVSRRVQQNSKAAELEEQHPLIFDELSIDLEKRKVVLKEERVDLSKKEFEILALLASKPGKSYSRNNILNIIWGNDFEGFEHTVNSHINRLRAKIEPDMSKPKYIITSWGVGYRFNEDI